MRFESIFLRLILGSMALLVAFIGSLKTASAGDPQDKNSPKKYAKSFDSQDLTKRDFSNQKLDNCNFENADLTETNFKGASLKNCSFVGATLRYTIFQAADLTGSDFRETIMQQPIVQEAILNKVNFEELDLSPLYFVDLKMRGINLRNTKGIGNITGCDLFEADLRGANLSGAYENRPAILRKAKYDQYTRWKDGFDTKGKGLIYVETKDEPNEPGDRPTNPDAEKEAEFAKLDTNQDGVLSGKEAASCKDRDTNKDGEVTLAEYLGNG